MSLYNATIIEPTRFSYLPLPSVKPMITASSVTHGLYFIQSRQLPFLNTQPSPTVGIGYFFKNASQSRSRMHRHSAKSRLQREKTACTIARSVSAGYTG